MEILRQGNTRNTEKELKYSSVPGDECYEDYRGQRQVAREYCYGTINVGQAGQYNGHRDLGRPASLTRMANTWRVKDFEGYLQWQVGIITQKCEMRL